MILSKLSATVSSSSSLRSDRLTFLLERGCSAVLNVSYGRPAGSFFISFLVCVRCFIHLSIKFSGVCGGGLAAALSTAIYFLGVPVSPVLYGNVSAIIRTEIKKCWKTKVSAPRNFAGASKTISWLVAAAQNCLSVNI